MPKAYVIVHLPTNQIMPFFKTNRGYSHWDPGSAPQTTPVIPRLFASKKAAALSANAWAKGVWTRDYHHNGFDEEYDDLTIRPVKGRSIEQLEICELTYTLKSLRKEPSNA